MIVHPAAARRAHHTEPESPVGPHSGTDPSRRSPSCSVWRLPDAEPLVPAQALSAGRRRLDVGIRSRRSNAPLPSERRREVDRAGCRVIQNPMRGAITGQVANAIEPAFKDGRRRLIRRSSRTPRPSVRCSRRLAWRRPSRAFGRASHFRGAGPRASGSIRSGPGSGVGAVPEQTGKARRWTSRCTSEPSASTRCWPAGSTRTAHDSPTSRTGTFLARCAH